MATQAVQQVVGYLTTPPEAARKAVEWTRAHPGDFRSALGNLATERGWDLSQIDAAELARELTGIGPH